MCSGDTLFVDVLLPLRLPGTYTYRLPAEFKDAVGVGQRVVVQFGSKRLYSAVVRRIHANGPEYKTKEVLSVLDINPIVNEAQLRFWEWMASYYMCYPGEVMAVAIPSAFRLSSESSIVIHPDFNGEIDDLSEDEIRVVDVLASRGRLAVDEVATITGYHKIMPLIKTMIEKHVVLMEEELEQRYTPKVSTWLALAEKYQGEAQLKALFGELEKKSTLQKQLMVLMKFLQLSDFGKKEVKKADIANCKELSSSALKTLMKNEVLVAIERRESRLQSFDKSQSVDSIVLNDEQKEAYNTISQCDKSVCLLHGVTSSGKTEVYIHLINDVVKRGEQVLFLLPEIALTAQVINRLRRFFGNDVGVYHSRFNTNERAEVWQRTMDPSPSGYKIILGARSAVFLPFHKLGLVIVDEEHDSSYKQNDPAPRYNGRDSAIYLAHSWKARVVLGSATPSLESFFHAENGKYGLATMTHRYGGLKMPEVLCVDMKEAHRRKEVQTHFSKFLLTHIKEALDNKEQVILFQNRRGFSLRIECDACGWIPQCRNCDVSLVYHKATNSLRCHYCGYSIPVPSECPACHSSSLRMRGFGTERIEDDLGIIFPEARIERMDLDATAQKKRYMDILNDFDDGKIDILVGTQMVTKGLDFNNVSIVGIVSADNLISFPDFRSYERGFQQITQVSGRAGRHGNKGTVIIQTFQPYHQAIRDAMAGDYESMYKSQITERRVFKYPPYYKLVSIVVRHLQENVVSDAAAAYAAMLRQQFGTRVMGPEFPNVARIRGQYLKKIMVRFAQGEALGEGKRIMMRQAEELLQDKAFRRVQIIFDVDPQ